MLSHKHKFCATINYASGFEKHFACRTTVVQGQRIFFINVPLKHQGSKAVTVTVHKNTPPMRGITIDCPEHCIEPDCDCEELQMQVPLSSFYEE